MTLSEIMSIVDNAQSLSNVETKHHLKSAKLVGWCFLFALFTRMRVANSECNNAYDHYKSDQGSILYTWG